MPSYHHTMLAYAVLLFSLSSHSAARCFAETGDQAHFFESKVRPLLAEQCFKCHNAKKKQGDLRLDRKQFVFEEGAAGTAVVPNKLSESRLWAVIQYDELDTQMPPTGKLTASKIEILKKWIESGAYWPDEAPVEATENENGIPLKADGSIDFEKAIQHHWAYQPVTEPTVPVVNAVSSPIDRFIVAKLHEKKLSLSEPASKRHLIRRLSFDLRGLPPSFQEVQDFENNASETAYAELVNRYLADSAYGQRWGRYWLDLARYADTKGYVFTENRFYPYSYTYRDYVIDAFNADKPYDNFLMEQLAADHLGYPENDPRLAALGFLTIGPRFLNRLPDIIDDRIDVVTRGLMGMTMGCSRCHDHKFDPLPTADYYSLYGVFNSCFEPKLPPLRGNIDTKAPEFKEFNAELAKREAKLNEYVTKTHAELLNQACDQLEDYFPAAVKSMGVLPPDLKLTPKHGPPGPRLTLHWKNSILKLAKVKHAFFIPSARLLALKGDDFKKQLTQILDELSANEEIPKPLRDALQGSKLESKIDVVNVYVSVLATVRDEWKALQAGNANVTELPDPDKEKIRRVLYGEGSISDLDSGENSPLFNRDHRNKIRKFQKEIGEWQATSPQAPPRSMVLFDKEKLTEPVVFERGNVGRRGDRVPRRGPQILNPNPDAIFTETSGRKELAEQIASKQNPLTARVIVNRIWKYHFGTALVETTSDFGSRTASPIHRELLDYLAWSLMNQHNWSLKELHKEILLSKTWQQKSVDNLEARKVDPENQLYWKQNRQRLDFEAMRDSMLMVSGKIDLAVGGRPVNIETQPFPMRRTVYALIDRNNPSGLLRTFDFPSPNYSSPARSETTVPQQALYGMNSIFAQEMATALAERVRSESSSPEEHARKFIEIAYSRSATNGEIAVLQEFLKENALDELAQGIMLSNEFFFVD